MGCRNCNILALLLGDERNRPWLTIIFSILGVGFLVFMVYFAIAIVPSKFSHTITPGKFIELKLDRDFFIGGNKANYKGYIRFEDEMLRYPGSQQRPLIAKLVLKLKKDASFIPSIKIELFDKDYKLITEKSLQKNYYAPIVLGHSSNYLFLELDKTSSLGDIKYFKYSLVAE